MLQPAPPISGPVSIVSVSRSHFTIRSPSSQALLTAAIEWFGRQRESFLPLLIAGGSTSPATFVAMFQSVVDWGAVSPYGSASFMKEGTDEVIVRGVETDYFDGEE